jgi:beta-glucosidase-like glycosyl hydrolase
MDEIHSELAEIDENLVRAELHYMDRAELLKRRQEIYEELHPAATAEEKRKAGLKQFNRDETVSSRTGAGNTFVSDTSKKTGLSERAVQQDLQLAKNLDEGAKEQIKKKKISKGDALKVAREQKENQQKAIKDLTEKPKTAQKPPAISTDALPQDFSIDEFIEKFNSKLKIKNIRIAKESSSSIIIWAEEQTLKNIIGSLGVIFAGIEEKKC